MYKFGKSILLFTIITAVFCATSLLMSSIMAATDLEFYIRVTSIIIGISLGFACILGFLFVSLYSPDMEKTYEKIRKERLELQKTKTDYHRKIVKLGRHEALRYLKEKEL